MRYRTTLLLHGKTATGFEVPDDVVAELGRGRRVPVVVTINGYSYRTTVAPYGGRNLIPLNAENRAGAGIEAGDEVDLDLEVDDEPRTVEVPDDLAAALADAGARAAFDALSFTAQREIVTGVLGAKRAETRERRIAQAVASLGA
ncbi:YdeI/OmpD-associated family protein [Cellulomonas alba]|uniref:YdeI/OmpD-associated family protein n=1 Tax=Cellulomonas alba TaxID=3053467 RepID=A0ABT7SEX4_9CELL|nr:YdeI/OmpD-associated family protein [Cellulomonas alba]MDM7854718.1 YdeI/OmpD-associated family protein [Cellulomonas alba]